MCALYLLTVQNQINSLIDKMYKKEKSCRGNQLPPKTDKNWSISGKDFDSDEMFSATTKKLFIKTFL